MRLPALVPIAAALGLVAPAAAPAATVSVPAGSYSAVGGGGALVGGAGGIQLGNEKGVRITLKGPKAGMEFAANLSSIQISLK